MAVMHSSPDCLVIILILDHREFGFGLAEGLEAVASEEATLPSSLVSFGVIMAVLESLELSFSSGWMLESALVETDSSILPFFIVSLLDSKLGLEEILLFCFNTWLL